MIPKNVSEIVHAASTFYSFIDSYFVSKIPEAKLTSCGVLFVHENVEFYLNN